MSQLDNRGLLEFRQNVLGIKQKVPVNQSQKVNYINFDNAASTPALQSVMKEVGDFLSWYSGVHRGTGYKSLLSSQLYDEAHAIIGQFLQADMDKNTVIFLKNTTEAINKLAYRFHFSSGDMVLTTKMEHHSNDLPWRQKALVKYAEVNAQGVLDIADVEKKLKHNYPRVKLLAVAGASNVTGHINDIYRLAELAHEHKAMIMVDGAQLVPHQRVDLKANHHPQHIDFIAFSGHKTYAPFGTGVLIGPREVFLKGDPEYVGGGTVDMVTSEKAFWSHLPDREEAGSPNVLGAFALARTLQYLEKFGMEKIAAYENNLCDYALSQLKTVPGLIIYGSFPRVGVISLNMQGFRHAQLGAILCYEAGIGVRTGCFCAQAYVRRLLEEKENLKYLSVYQKKETDKLPGMVRVSLAAYNTKEEIDKLVDYLKIISRDKKYYLQHYQISSAGHSYLPPNLEQRFQQEMIADCRALLEP